MFLNLCSSTNNTTLLITFRSQDRNIIYYITHKNKEKNSEVQWKQDAFLKTPKGLVMYHGHDELQRRH